MPSPAREAELTDSMWERVAPLLPPNRAQPNGGRPFADDKRCFKGIVHMLRNGLRWNAIPKAEFGGYATCWRRFDRWTKLGLWPQVHAIVLEELQEAGLLDTSELFADATFAEARKGGSALALQNVGSAPKSRS